MDISYECINQGTNSDTYKVTVKFYRDCEGIANWGTLYLDYSSSCGSNSTSLTQVGNAVNINPNCLSYCNGGSGIGIEQYTYEAVINLSKCSNWVLSVCEAARNNSIGTISNPGQEDLCVEATLNNIVFCNNSPTFTQYPTPFICVGSYYCYNNGAVEIDGDSLVYSLVTPLVSNNGGTVNYIPPYSITNPVGGGSSFDPNTGNLCVTPPNLITGVLAIKVTEYRNGLIIGSIIRDIQINTFSCSATNPPQLSAIDTSTVVDISNSNTFTEEINCPNGTQNINFDINAINNNPPAPMGYQFTINITSGTWPNEVSWDIYDPNGAGAGTIIASGGAPYTGTICLPATNLGNLQFRMYDSWGDGWNGGTYDVTSNGTSVASGGMTSGSSFTDTLCLPTGCYDVTVGGGFYDSEITFDFASLVGSAAGTYTDISVGGAICGVVVVNGCTDSTALNYDPTATVDDGSCVYCVYGCTDSTAVNYAALATCDDGTCIASVYGCTDATACNYYAGANVDDGSCEWTSCNPTTCGASPITGLGVTNVIHDRVTLTFDNMNTYDALGAQICRVDQLRIKYREVGTSSWSQKNMAAPTGYDPTTGICNSTQNTDKLVLGLTGSTTYEWRMKVWYCGVGNSGWVSGPNFTTLGDCPNVGNLTVTSPTTTKATFTWDDSNGAYSFVRLQARVDAVGTSFFNIGGIGVNYPTFTKNKNGLVPGESYRAKSRTWCDPNGGAYKALSWTSFIYWTQPTSIRLEGGSAINNLTIYPNPSRDVFNVSFTSDTKQSLKVRILNVIGEELINENLEQFIGEYTKQINLSENAKGIYFLEIETNDGIINKKLILQ